MREVTNTTADLHHRGRAPFGSSSFWHRLWAKDEVLPDEPLSYAYGSYTRYGSVSELVSSADDTFAIMRHGDEIELSFYDPEPIAQGMARSYFLKADIFYTSAATR